jgi:hypothetical protein
MLGWTRWKAIRETGAFFADPTVPRLRLPEGSIVMTETYSSSAQTIWFRLEIMPGFVWLDTEQFNRDFERIG